MKRLLAASLVALVWLRKGKYEPAALTFVLVFGFVQAAAISLGGLQFSRDGLKNVLVVAQVALSLLLLVGAGLFLRSLRNATAIDAGLNTESVLLASVNPDLNGYAPPEIANFYHQLEERLRELPGVRAVGASEAALLSGDFSSVGLIVPGQPLPPSGPARGILAPGVAGKPVLGVGGRKARWPIPSPFRAI